MCHHPAWLPASDPLQPDLCGVSHCLPFWTSPAFEGHCAADLESIFKRSSLCNIYPVWEWELENERTVMALKLKVNVKMKHFFSRKDGDDKARPVIIHRAILGSVERMIAILTENYAGKWYDRSCTRKNPDLWRRLCLCCNVLLKYVHNISQGGWFWIRSVICHFKFMYSVIMSHCVYTDTYWWYSWRQGLLSDCVLTSVIMLMAANFLPVLQAAVALPTAGHVRACQSFAGGLCQRGTLTFPQMCLECPGYQFCHPLIIILWLLLFLIQWFVIAWTSCF